MNNIYLASASPRRKELLTQIGISYKVIPSMAEEVTDKIYPQDIVQELSRMKAADVAEQVKDTDEEFAVIGADTVVAFEEQIMGKPKDAEDAKGMLRRLQGNTHQVYTGVTLISKKRGEEAVYGTFYVCTDVTISPMSEKEIEDYTKTEEPLDKAGSYAIQERFAIFIKEIRGDFYNVVGLPISRLYQEMKKRNLL